jgi:hypothetical protein
VAGFYGNKVTLKVRIHSGSSFDPQGREGVMKILAENIFPTPESRDFFKDDLGGSLEIVSNLRLHPDQRQFGT